MAKASITKDFPPDEVSCGRANHEKTDELSQGAQLKSSARIRSLAIGLIPVVIISLVSLVVYVNALSGAFVYDDDGQIVNNPWIRDIRNIPAVFSSSVWSFQAGPVVSNYYRPLMHIAYMLSYHLFGLQPLGFHLVNILFHCSVSVLVFLVIKRLLAGQNVSPPSIYLSPAFLAALFFASHPVHTEAVTWIAGLPDVAFSFFYLLSFYLYVRSEAMRSASYLVSVVCFVIAAFFKEPALTLPVILFAYDYVLCERRSSVPDTVKRYLPYLAMGAGYLALRVHALGAFAPEKRHMTLSAYQYAINVFPLFSQYLGKLLLPINLNAFYVFHPIFSLTEAKGVVSLMVTVAFMAALVVALKKNKLVFWGLLFVAVPLLPALYIPGLGENTFTDRYLYLPSVGYVLLLAVLLSWARVKVPHAAMGITIVFLLTTGVYGYGTITRNIVWKDDFNLWSDTVKKSPESADAHNNFGLASAAKGEIDMAITEYQTALRLKPDDALAYNNLGVSYASKGLPDMAIAEFQTVLRLYPDYAEAHSNLGNAYASKGLPDMAISQFQIALRLNPDYAEAHYNLGNAYASKGLPDMAISQFQMALRLNPDYAEAHNNFGLAYAAKGEQDRAIAEYQTVLRLKPASVKAHYNLGVAYASKGLPDMAVAEFQTVLRLKPDFVEAHNNLGNAYASKGQMDRAISEFQAALHLNHDFVEVHNNLGNAYASKGQMDRAISEFQVALHLNPDYVDAHYDLANAYISRGLLDMAISEWQTVLRLRPDDAETHFNLASVYLRQGRTVLARKEAEVLINIRPDSNAARQLLNDINSRGH